MGMPNVITPVLIEVEETRYKLVYINFTRDGSIYILFPRKKGYKIVKEKNIPDDLIGKKDVSLKKVFETYDAPYISFHPGKESIHVNCSSKTCYKIDAKVINMAENKKILAFPMCQIIFPTFTYFDQYDSGKYTTPLVLNSKTLNPNVGLNLEFWIHPLNTYFELHDLPYHKIKQREMNFVNAMKFQNTFLKFYTCTLVLWEIPVNKKDDTVPGIIVSIPNKRQQYVFEMVPNN